MAKVLELRNKGMVVFLDGELSEYALHHKAKYFRAYHEYFFRVRVKPSIPYLNGLPIGLAFNKVYSVSEIPQTILEWKKKHAAEIKAAEAAKKQAELEAAKKKEAEKEWATRSYPVEGDYVLVLNELGQPSEEFSFVLELEQSTAENTFIVADIYGKHYEVAPVPERDDYQLLRKTFRVLAEVMAG